jgi:diacylglycerol kinase (ATP)
MADEWPDTCVIFNPAAGKRRARHALHDLQRQYADRAVFWPTQRPGHASELARQAAAEGFAVVAAAGGDGTVHEVANGLLASQQPNIVFAVIPLGSANDYAYSLRRDQVATPWRVDVGIVRNSSTQRYFVNGLGIGFSGSVTAESRRIHRLQGRWLYGLATVRALWKQWRYLDLTLSLDDKPAIHDDTLMLSVMVAHREGGFLMAPDARLDDGWFDIVRAGRLSRCEVLGLLARLNYGGLPRDHTKLQFARCRTLTVTSQQPLAIHTDGELFCQPDDDVCQVEIELIEKRLAVQLGLASRSG